MLSRILVILLAAVLMAAVPMSALAHDSAADDFARRDDEVSEIVSAEEDDDDGDSGGATGNSGTGDSNDGTGSGHTAVSRDRDRSRGDLTRDRTKDGPGASTRDWRGGPTNDRSRNDTRRARWQRCRQGCSRRAPLPAKSAGTSRKGTRSSPAVTQSDFWVAGTNTRLT